MFCPNCGFQNADGVSCCQNCSTALTAQQGYQQQNNQPYQSYAQPNVYGATIRSTHPVINAVKNKGASVMFLVAVIAFSAAGLFGFLNSISGTSGIFGYLYRLVSMLDMEDFIGDIYFAANGVSVFSAVIGMIPTILLGVGMWMTYASAANRRESGMKTAGLTIIKVISIINLVFMCIVLAIAEIILLIAVVNVSNSFFGTSEVVGLLIGAMIGVLIGMTLMILYYVKLVKTINTMKMTITTGTPSDNVSAYVAVIAIIGGVLSAFSALPIGGILGYGVNVLAMLSGICSAIASITFGAFIFSYKKAIRAFMMPQSYAQPYAVPTAEPAYNTYQNIPQQPYVAYSQQSNISYDQPTTALDNDSFTTCISCGMKYDSQNSVCPYCGQEK